MSQPDHTIVGLGLDIGMTYCGAAASYYPDGDSWIRVEDIETAGQGSEYRTPSTLFYPEGAKEPIIGFQALKRLLDGVKGRPVERFKRLFAHTTKRDENRRAITDTAELIKYLNRDIARHLSATGLQYRQSRYAFSHPGSWGHAEKQDFLKAINAAGISSAALIEEPVAAALAAAFTPKLAHNLRGERVVMVCDIGGGTTDLSLVAFEADGAIKMLGQTDGNLELGMSNLDQLLGLMIFDKTRGISDPAVLQPLAHADVVGKRLQDAWDKLPLTVVQRTGLLHTAEKLKREIFNDIANGSTSMWPAVWEAQQYHFTLQDITPIVESLKHELHALIAHYLKHLTSYRADQINLVLVTGGGVNIPTIREKGFFNKVLPEAEILVAGRNAQLLVQEGTAIHATNPELVSARIPNASYGIQRQNGFETFIEVGVALSKEPVEREERVAGFLVNQIKLVVFEQFPGRQPRAIYEGKHALPLGARDGKYKVRFMLGSDGLVGVEIQSPITRKWALMKQIEINTNR